MVIGFLHVLQDTKFLSLVPLGTPAVLGLTCPDVLPSTSGMTFFHVGLFLL